MKNKLKISSFEKIHHIVLNKNKSKTMNDLLVNNNNNDSNSDNFVLTALFMCFISLIIVFNVTICQNER